MVDAEYESQKAAYLRDARRLQQGRAPQDPAFYSDDMRQAFIARDVARTEAKSVDARSLPADDYAAARAAFLKTSR